MIWASSPPGYSKHLPIFTSFFQLFDYWNFLPKELHGNAHEQAAVVSVAAGGIDSNEYHQEDDHDDANHSAFGHAALGWWERGKSLNVQTENIKHLYSDKKILLFR